MQKGAAVSVKAEAEQALALDWVAAVEAQGQKQVRGPVDLVSMPFLQSQIMY